MERMETISKRIKDKFMSDENIDWRELQDDMDDIDDPDEMPATKELIEETGINPDEWDETKDEKEYIEEQYIERKLV
jgi:transcriptional regulator of met regulon